MSVCAWNKHRLNRFSATIQIIQINCWHMIISRQRDEYLENNFPCCETKWFPKKFKQAHVTLAYKKTVYQSIKKPIHIIRASPFARASPSLKQLGNFKIRFAKCAKMTPVAHVVCSDVGKNKRREWAYFAPFSGSPYYLHVHPLHPIQPYLWEAGKAGGLHWLWKLFCRHKAQSSEMTTQWMAEEHQIRE